MILIQKTAIDADFTKTPNLLLNDTRLTGDEKILIIFLLSHKNNFNINNTFIANGIGKSRKFVINAFKKLKTLGIIYENQNELSINYTYKKEQSVTKSNTKTEDKSVTIGNTFDTSSSTSSVTKGNSKCNNFSHPSVTKGNSKCNNYSLESVTIGNTNNTNKQEEEQDYNKQEEKKQDEEVYSSSVPDKQYTATDEDLSSLDDDSDTISNIYLSKEDNTSISSINNHKEEKLNYIPSDDELEFLDILSNELENSLRLKSLYENNNFSISSFKGYTISNVTYYASEYARHTNKEQDRNYNDYIKHLKTSGKNSLFNFFFYLLKYTNNPKLLYKYQEHMKETDVYQLNKELKN